VSDPTYRIDVARTSLLPDPYPWKARVFRLSDDELVAAGVGLTKAEALEMARELIQRMTYGEDTASSFYVGDDGMPVEGHSVKA
jgi:hypothetical protein